MFFSGTFQSDEGHLLFSAVQEINSFAGYLIGNYTVGLYLTCDVTNIYPGVSYLRVWINITFECVLS